MDFATTIKSNTTNMKFITVETPGNTLYGAFKTNNIDELGDFTRKVKAKYHDAFVTSQLYGRNNWVIGVRIPAKAANHLFEELLT